MTSAQVTELALLLRRSGRTVECEVAGESMGSVAPDAATARIRCDGAVGAPEGSVVALLLGGALTVHRLVHRGRSARAQGWVVTEGDANLTCDAPGPRLPGHRRRGRRARPRRRVAPGDGADDAALRPARAGVVRAEDGLHGTRTPSATGPRAQGSGGAGHDAARLVAPVPGERGATRVHRAPARSLS